jgi:uncharacterized protein YllA (UPF0747 family)
VFTSVPLSSSPQIQKNIEKLCGGKAVAVITGQQPCLFGGPSLVIHKVATAISICQWLQSQGLEAVPVFWNASEDHDLHEILQTNVLYANMEVKKVKKDFDSLKSAESLKALSSHEFPKDFSPNLKKLFLSNSSDWGRQFGAVMAEIFSSCGLVVVEPRDFRSINLPFWNLVEKQQRDLAIAYEKSEANLLKNGMALQAPRRQKLPIFKLNPDSGERELLRDDEFSVKSLAEPWVHSPGALLRPLMAQYHLPIAISVLGPSEYMYHQQIVDAYGALGLDRPTFWPRLSGTWIPAKIRTILQKHGLNIDETLLEPKGLQQHFAKSESLESKAFSLHMKNLLLESQRQFPEELGGLQRLEQDLYKALNRFDRHLQRIQWKEKGLTPLEIHRLQEFITPKGQPQERILSWSQIISDTTSIEKILNIFKNPFDFSHRFYD